MSSITSSVGRLYNRIEEQIKKSVFKPGNFCTDNILSLKQLGAENIAQNRVFYLMLIDS